MASRRLPFAVLLGAARFATAFWNNPSALTPKEDVLYLEPITEDSQTNFTVKGQPDAAKDSPTNGTTVEIPAVDWAEIMATSNVTGTYDIPGVNLTESYPGSSLDGWKLSVNLKSDIPVGKEFNNTEEQYWAGWLLALEPPANLVDPAIEKDGEYVADESWSVCVTQFMNDPGVSDIGKGHECKSFFGSGNEEDCVVNFEKHFQDSWQDYQADTSKVLKVKDICPDVPREDIETYTVCSRARGDVPLRFSKWDVEGRVETVPAYNSSLQWSEVGIGKTPVESVGAYNVLGRHVTPVMVTFGFDGEKTERREKPVTKLVCATPVEVKEGSDAPTTSGGISLPKHAIVSLLVSGFVAIFLL